MKKKNVIILFIILILIGTSYFISRQIDRRFRSDVVEAFNRTKNITPDIITENDIQHLPSIVQKYLLLSGVVGNKKIINFKATLEGKIRSKPEDDWMNLTSEQYNFYDQPTRLFYIEARKMGIKAKGIHIYKDEKAIMLIKILGLFTVADAKGPEMDQGETVTVLNDMCFLAPATLIYTNIKWHEIDSLTVNATYTNKNITISANLLFNEKGELINFKSNDRFESTDGKKYKYYPWSTPAGEYKDYNGIKRPSMVSTIYHKPKGDFCYGEFYLKDIEYNCKAYK